MEPSYDINEIFSQMEHELIESYKRNLSRHLDAEAAEGFEWDMWQSKKIDDLRQLRKEARVIINKHKNRAAITADGILVDTYMEGKELSDTVIKRFRKGIEDSASFGKTDRRKLNAIMDAVNNDFDKAAASALRLIDDEYRKTVYKTQVAYSAGTKTLAQAIDVASSDFLAKGINNIVYRNGNRVNIASYAEMVMRTSAKRAKLTGEGARNAELGVFLVQITQYGACSELCLPWQGRVFVDDVYSGGKPDGVHELLSVAMANGLFHPNCRHTSQPFFEGISYAPVELDTEQIRINRDAESRQREIERNIRRYKRISAGSVDDDNRAKADRKVRQWQAEMRSHLRENRFLSRKSYREKLI